MTALKTTNLRSLLSYTVHLLALKHLKTMKTPLLRLLKNPNSKSKNKVVGGSSEAVTAIMMGLRRSIAGYHKRHQMIWIFLQSNNKQ